MLKHSILIGVMFLFLSPSFATEIDSETWSFKGNFKHTFSHGNGTKLNRYFKCKNNNDNSSIETLKLVGYIDSTVRLIFSLKKSDSVDNISFKNRLYQFGSFSQMIQELIEDESEEDLYFSLSHKGPLVLEFLYYSKQVPDFVVDRLLKETDWPDFRLNEKWVLEYIRKDRSGDKSQEYFEKLALYYLNKLSNNSKKSEIAKHLSQKLPKGWSQLKSKLSPFILSKL